MSRPQLSLKKTLCQRRDRNLRRNLLGDRRQRFGKELGFVGCILVLIAFWLVCLRLVIIAQNAKDNFGSLIAIGVFSMIVFQVAINVGMTIGLSPVTGIPLPFLSYGKSALLMNFLAIGVVQSVSNFRQRLKF